MLAARDQPPIEWQLARRKSGRVVSTGELSLLDVACGTGLHLQHLAPRFGHVEGLDLNERMLALARDRLPGVPLHHGDMLDFDLGRRFDVITCLFSAIGHMKRYADMSEAVATAMRLPCAMRRGLAPPDAFEPRMIYKTATEVDGWVSCMLGRRCPEVRTAAPPAGR